jgi:uncharacterized protein YceH (UPF0502 family)
VSLPPDAVSPGDATSTPPGPPPGALVLNATERRILGVLIEKGLTTPEYYPLTVSALVAGCNQKNNRDPLTQFDESLVEDALKLLEQRGLVLSVLPESGRVTRWRQELTRKLALSVTELAVLGELFLRGAQSEGDLRGRANRMRPIETLEALRALLDGLRRRSPPMVLRLSPDGAARGARFTHGFAAAEQLAKWRADEGAAGNESVRASSESTATSRLPPTSAPSEPSNTTLAALEARVAALEERVRRLESPR